MEYTFFVPGKPEPQSRPRFSVRKDRYGRATGVNARDTEQAKAYKVKVYTYALDAFKKGGKVMLNGPLELNLIVWREVPKSYTKKQRQAIHDGMLFPTQKPDLDNYIKAALDGVGLKDLPKIIFGDDSQVVKISAQKRFSESGQLGMAVQIKELMPTVARGNLNFEGGKVDE